MKGKGRRRGRLTRDELSENYCDLPHLLETLHSFRNRVVFKRDLRILVCLVELLRLGSLHKNIDLLMTVSDQASVPRVGLGALENDRNSSFD